MNKSVFITYSWDDQIHKDWVRKLADKLIENGVDVKLDQYDLQLGESSTHFMEKSIIETDKILVILTPQYKQKSQNRSGGVGYEQQIISGEIMAGVDRKKFIPALKFGTYEDGEHCCIPTHFKGIVSLDFRDENIYEQSIEELLRNIFDIPKHTKPIKGLHPKFTSEKIYDTFEIHLDQDFNLTQSETILSDIFLKIADARKSNIIYDVKFKIEDISEIYNIYTSLATKNDLSEHDLKLKLKYREFLNIVFYNDNSDLYKDLETSMNNIIDYSYNKFKYIDSIYKLYVAIKNCFSLFSANQQNKIFKGTGFDVFYDKYGWCFKIYISEEDVTNLESIFNSTKIDRILLTRFGGLDTSDLSRDTIIERLIPKQSYAFTFNYIKSVEEKNKELFFNVGNWNIGLA